MTLCEKESTSVTLRVGFVQFILMVTSISYSTECEKVNKIVIETTHRHIGLTVLLFAVLSPLPEEEVMR